MSSGTSTQRIPDFSTCTMPLMTRQSSTRGLPRVSLGRSGLSFPNWAAVSQKWSRIIHGLPLQTVNHKTPVSKMIFMGPDPRILPIFTSLALAH